MKETVVLRWWRLWLKHKNVMILSDNLPPKKLKRWYFKREPFVKANEKDSDKIELFEWKAFLIKWELKFLF